MGTIGPCVFLLKFSVAVCILLVKKLESMLFCVRVNIVSGDNYSTVHLVTDNITTKSGSLRNSMQKCGGKYCGGEKILSPQWFQHCGGECPRRSDASGPDTFWAYQKTLFI